ncbi:MAG: calcium/sodium antiporter [Gemmatimonadota bacterium]|nr:calcium/sodium antiporter [Gemmatimonadota bacterium]
MTLQLLELVVGFAVLVGGAEMLVRGAITLSRRLGVSSLVVGLTVVALGTSFPELFVSVIASARGEPAVALGNVIGSNIFNIAVILGVGAIIRPVRVELRLLQLEIPFVLFITVLFPLLATDGAINRVDAAILLVLFVSYMLYVRWTARRDSLSVESDVGDASTEGGPRSPATGSLWMAVVLVVAGLMTMAFAGRWLVDTATDLARLWGVSERVIGLTLIAGGTSLPELASTLLAFLRRESDLAVGSLLGSNVFNSLAILGTAAMVNPLAPTRDFLRVDMLVMLLTIVLLIPLARSRSRIGRWEGLGLFGIYVGYMLLILLGPTRF